MILLPLGYMVVIFLLSSIPDNPDSSRVIKLLPNTLQDLLHIPLFGILTILWIITLKKKGWKLNESIRYAIIISGFYGLTDEIHQSIVPGRYASLSDFSFNLLGIMVVVAFYKLLIMKDFY
jgi:VanZ family protein